jgi:hypothetical protein
MKAVTRCIIFLLFVVLLGQAAHADVVPGETIDKTNYQKIEGLVPDFIVTWVKNGDMTMKIGKLKFDNQKYWDQETLDNWQANIGRYKIDENNGIIDVKTGKPARYIKGLAFPEPNPKDPTLPVQLMWANMLNSYYLQGDTHAMGYWLSFSRRGLEKTLVLEDLSHIFDPSKSDFDYAQLSVFRQPYSMAGTGTLALYPIYPLGIGDRFAYAPELKRVRRMSHRLTGSDVYFGFDQAPDDSWAGGPKTNTDEGIYRYIGEKEALVPYLLDTPLKLKTEAKFIGCGYAETGFEIKMGSETPGWTGAPWHVTNVIWVKSKVWIIESKSKKSTYNYGPCEGWVEQKTFSHCYKRITDPSGKLWKGFYWPALPIETTDGKFKGIQNEGQVVVDMRRDHGSSFPGAYTKGGFKKIMIKDTNETLFTRGGFIKFYK